MLHHCSNVFHERIGAFIDELAGFHSLGVYLDAILHCRSFLMSGAHEPAPDYVPDQRKSCESYAVPNVSINYHMECLETNTVTGMLLIRFAFITSIRH
jgi:hypothetical protein